MQTLLDILEKEGLEDSPIRKSIPLDAAHLIVEGTKWLNFSSHDYLSLSYNSQLKKSAIKALLQEGTGLASTHLPLTAIQSQLRLEEKVAHLVGKEAVLLTSSYMEARFLSLNALASPPSLIFLPAKCNYPSYLSKAALSFYTNNLEELLERAEGSSLFSKIIVAHFPDAFSQNLIELAKKYRALIYTDITHLLGVIDIPPLFDPHHILVGSFENALASHGGFIASTKQVKHHLLHTYGHTCNFTLSGACIASIDTAIELLPHMEGEKRKLAQRAFWIKTQLEEMEIELERAPPHFLVLPTKNCASLQRMLDEQHILADYHDNKATFILNTHHSLEELRQLLDTLQLWHSREKAILS